jgi:hypothetical protein
MLHHDGGLPASTAPLAAELDSDTVHAILVRLVAASGEGGADAAARRLTLCARVCRLWYAASLSETLWRDLCGAWGRRAGHVLAALEASRRPPHEPQALPHSHRELFVRAATTQVLVWGNAGRSPKDETLAGSRVRAALPALLGGNGLRGKGIREVAAGDSFSCAVSVRRRNAACAPRSVNMCTGSPGRSRGLARSYPGAKTPRVSAAWIPA